MWMKLFASIAHQTLSLCDHQEESDTLHQLMPLQETTVKIYASHEILNELLKIVSTNSEIILDKKICSLKTYTQDSERGGICSHGMHQHFQLLIFYNYHVFTVLGYGKLL